LLFALVWLAPLSVQRFEAVEKSPLGAPTYTYNDVRDHYAPAVYPTFLNAHVLPASSPSPVPSEKRGRTPHTRHVHANETLHSSQMGMQARTNERSGHACSRATLAPI